MKMKFISPYKISANVLCKITHFLYLSDPNFSSRQHGTSPICERQSHMLRCSALLTTRRVAKWGSSGVFNRGSATIAIPTFFEPVAPSASLQVPGIAVELKGILNRCIALVQSTSRHFLTPTKSLESSILLTTVPQPSQYSEGIIKRSRAFVRDLRSNLFREVYPDYPSAKKKWIWRLVAANAFSFILWQVRTLFSDILLYLLYH